MQAFRGLELYKRDTVEDGYDSDCSMTWAPPPLPPFAPAPPPDYRDLDRDPLDEEEVSQTQN